MLWKAFESVGAGFFVRAVDIALSEHKGSAPLVPDLNTYVERARLEYSQSRVQSSANFTQILNRAANKDEHSDPEFVKQAAQIREDYLRGKLTRDQFVEACDLLERAAAHLVPAEKKSETAGLLPGSTAIPYRIGDKDD